MPSLRTRLSATTPPGELVVIAKNRRLDDIIDDDEYEGIQVFELTQGRTVP
jgi:hypothetical protein